MSSYDILKKITNNPPWSTNSSSAWEWHTTFVGQYMQHNYRLYHILDSIFLENPQITRIVEMGTGNGALSVFLGLWGIKKGIPLLTNDISLMHDTKLFSYLKINFIQGDENSLDIKEKIECFLDKRACLFICDGASGGKETEFKYWVNKLSSSSIIAAHDLGNEFQVCNIAECLYLCEPYKVERWLEMNAQMAFFKIK